MIDHNKLLYVSIMTHLDCLLDRRSYLCINILFYNRIGIFWRIIKQTIYGSKNKNWLSFGVNMCMNFYHFFTVYWKKEEKRGKFVGKGMGKRVFKAWECECECECVALSFLCSNLLFIAFHPTTPYPSKTHFLLLLLLLQPKSMDSQYIQRHHNHNPTHNQCSSAIFKHIKAPVHLVHLSSFSLHISLFILL